MRKNTNQLMSGGTSPFARRRKGLGTSRYVTSTSCKNIADKSDKKSDRK